MTNHYTKNILQHELQSSFLSQKTCTQTKKQARSIMLEERWGWGLPHLFSQQTFFFNLQTENCKIFDPPFWEQVKTDLR